MTPVKYNKYSKGFDHGFVFIFPKHLHVTFATPHGAVSPLRPWSNILIICYLFNPLGSSLVQKRKERQENIFDYEKNYQSQIEQGLILGYFSQYLSYLSPKKLN